MARTIGITYTVEATLAFGTGPEVTYGLLLDLDTRQYYALYGAGFNVGIGAPAGATANFIFSNNVPAELNGYVAGFEQTAVGGLNLGVGGVLNGIGNGSGSGQLQVGPDVGIQAYFGGALVTPIVEEEIYNTFPSLVSQYEILKSFSDNNITDFSIDHEASYSNQLRYFDSDNELAFEYTGGTDGSSSVVNYERDLDSLVDNQTKYFDSDNNLYFEQTLNRDGSRSEIEYFSDLDAAVANQRRFYDSDNQVTFEEINNRDGTRVETDHFVDHDSQVANQTRYYDADNELTGQSTEFRDGTVVESDLEGSQDDPTAGAAPTVTVHGWSETLEDTVTPIDPETGEPGTGQSDPPPIITGAQVGAIFGSVIGNAIAGDDVFARIAVGSALSTALGFIGGQFDALVDTAGELATYNPVTHALDTAADIPTAFAANLQNAGVGALTSFLTAELAEGIGIDSTDFGGQLFNVTANTLAITHAANDNSLADDLRLVA